MRRSVELWGCDIKYRPRTHEKVVFIDNRIAYYGSLNTLSHLDTRETMFRFEGAEVIRLLDQFVGVIGIKPPPPPLPPNGGQWLTRDECRKKLRSMSYKIGTQRHIPFQSVLFNQTLEYLLDNPPTTEETLFDALQECKERQLKHIVPFLDEILSILQRYRPLENV